MLQLTRGPGVQQGSPDWSPDGDQIAFDSQGADANWDVYVIDSAGGAPRLLEPSPADEHHPTWSRDGRFIYFTSNRTGRFEIWRLPVAGGEAIQVTLDGGFRAQESMDGRTLFYSKRPPSRILFARPEAGGEEEKVFEGIGSYSWWSVSGHSVYYFGLRNDSTPGAVLRIFDLRTRTSRDMAVYNTSPGRPSLSPDQKTVVFDLQKPPNADLMLIEDFR